MKKFIDRLLQRKIASLDDCRLPPELSLAEMSNVLVFAPHPDDEILGCGGTLALLKKRGCQIKVVVITDGEAGDPLNYAGGKVATVRRQESVAALDLIGVQDVVFLGEPDGVFAGSEAFDEKISDIISGFRPDWLFLPSWLDYHRDHVAIGHAVFSAWQRSGMRGRTFAYEIWNPLPATRIVDISGVIDLKMAALAYYKLPLKYRDYLTPSRGLSAYRGLYLPPAETPRYAEAFLEVGRGDPRLVRRLLRLRLRLEDLLGQPSQQA